MKQKRNEKLKKRMILIGTLIVILAIGFSIFIGKQQQKKEKAKEQESGYDIPMETIKEWEEIALGKVKISHIKLKKEEDTYVLIATTKNTSNQTIEGYPIQIQLKDGMGNEIVQIGAYINKMEPKASNILNTSVAADLSKVEEIVISK